MACPPLLAAGRSAGPPRWRTPRDAKRWTFAKLRPGDEPTVCGLVPGFEGCHAVTNIRADALATLVQRTCRSSVRSALISGTPTDGKRPMADDKLTAASTSSVVGGVAGERTGDSPIARDTHRGDGGDVHRGAAEASRGVGRPDTEHPRLVCVVRADRANVLLPPLREHFAHEPLVAVVVERRTPTGKRRLLDPVGQRHRRAPIAERDPGRVLPPALRHEARHLRLVQRMEPLRRTYEDTDVADLVGKCLAVEPEAVSELWWRVSERVLARLRLRLGQLAAEDAARHILGRILDELSGYRAEQEPLTAWLDAVVDRYAEDRSPRSLGMSG